MGDLAQEVTFLTPRVTCLNLVVYILVLVHSNTVPQSPFPKETILRLAAPTIEFLSRFYPLVLALLSIAMRTMLQRVAPFSIIWSENKSQLFIITYQFSSLLVGCDYLQFFAHWGSYQKFPCCTFGIPGLDRRLWPERLLSRSNRRLCPDSSYTCVSPPGNSVNSGGEYSSCARWISVPSTSGVRGLESASSWMLVVSSSAFWPNSGIGGSMTSWVWGSRRRRRRRRRNRNHVPTASNTTTSAPIVIAVSVPAESEEGLLEELVVLDVLFADSIGIRFCGTFSWKMHW